MFFAFLVKKTSEILFFGPEFYFPDFFFNKVPVVFLTKKAKKLNGIYALKI